MDVDKIGGLEIPKTYEELKEEFIRVYLRASSAINSRNEEEQKNKALQNEINKLSFELEGQRTASLAFAEKMDNLKSNCDRLDIDAYLRESIDSLCIAKTRGIKVKGDSDDMPMGAIGIIREARFTQALVQYGDSYFLFDFDKIRIIHAITTYKEVKYFPEPM